MGPFLGTLNFRCRIIIRIQKGAIILTTIHFEPADSKSSCSSDDTDDCGMRIRSYLGCRPRHVTVAAEILLTHSSQLGIVLKSLPY